MDGEGIFLAVTEKCAPSGPRRVHGWQSYPLPCRGCVEPDAGDTDTRSGKRDRRS